MTEEKAAAPAAPVPEVPHPTARATRVRHAIDTGRTGDKIAAPDPAMSPLGTDDEAAQGHDEAGLKTARAAGSAKPSGKAPAADR